jgi:LAO/AO transport system kinase
LTPAADDAADISARMLSDRVRSGDLLSIARAISLIENGWSGTDMFLYLLGPERRNVPVVGFTGPPGAGKSTLISAYIRVLRDLGQRVAVVSVDPSSPTSGGAILGDRLRMHEHHADRGVFIRSVATRGHLGGLCRSIKDMVRILRAAIWDSIILETVGTGQSEIEVSRVADIAVVVNTPGFGDDVQAIKAGVLEIADVLVVNKAELPGAPAAIRDLESMLKLRPAGRDGVPVIATTATTGAGVAELRAAIVRRLSEKKG